MHLWHGEYAPFMYMAQMKYCRRLIVVPLSTFHRMAELIGDPKGELIFLFNTARCGSTLLTQVLFLRHSETHICTCLEEYNSKSRSLKKDDYLAAHCHVVKYYHFFIFAVLVMRRPYKLFFLLY